MSGFEMVMRLDRRKSESALVRRRFSDYGILQKCLDCPGFDRCGAPQYDAPGLTRFICKDPKKREKRQAGGPGPKRRGLEHGKARDRALNTPSWRLFLGGKR